MYPWAISSFMPECSLQLRLELPFLFVFTFHILKVHFHICCLILLAQQSKMSLFKINFFPSRICQIINHVVQSWKCYCLRFLKYLRKANVKKRRSLCWFMAAWLLSPRWSGPIYWTSSEASCWQGPVVAQSIWW